MGAEGHSVAELGDNYRWRGGILSLVNTVFGGQTGVEPHTLVAAAEWPATDRPATEFLWAYSTAGEGPAGIEALWVGRRVRGVAETIPVEEVAVLGGTVGAVEQIKRALDGFGVPWVVTGGRSFYEAREVRDLMAYLGVLANPLDELHLATVLRSPLVGAGDEVLLRMKRDADAGG